MRGYSTMELRIHWMRCDHNFESSKGGHLWRKSYTSVSLAKRFGGKPFLGQPLLPLPRVAEDPPFTHTGGWLHRTAFYQDRKYNYKGQGLYLPQYMLHNLCHSSWYCARLDYLVLHSKLETFFIPMRLAKTNCVRQQKDFQVNSPDDQCHDATCWCPAVSVWKRSWVGVQHWETPPPWWGGFFECMVQMT